MSENTLHKSTSNTNHKGNSPSGGTSLFSGVGKLEEIFEKGVPIQYMPKILFSVSLLVLYIMNSYLIAKKEMRIQKTKVQIEDLRTDYTTMKAEYMFSSKQSEVAKRVSKLGLKEGGNPPIRLKIKIN